MTLRLSIRAQFTLYFSFLNFARSLDMRVIRAGKWRNGGLRLEVEEEANKYAVGPVGPTAAVYPPHRKRCCGF
jgi:hypothetical protein